ncbi:hypothetical protein [Kitasatospora sp. NPDC050543]|uniref:hypothetical protein n=1 Tax=Kitasatospora sp. NPDC050543 TaxID=3364054 RepID=UPI0037B4CA20
MTDIDYAHEYEDDLIDDEPELDYADADAFFAAEVEHVQPAVLRLFGTDYTLPPRVPLAFNMLLARHSEDESEEALARVLAPLFGDDALAFWLTKGIDDRQLGIVLAWSIANIKKPGALSLADAARVYDEETARKTEGKARNRAERRARPVSGSGGRSSSTGRS